MRTGAAAGIVGPAVFTAAWIFGSLRQTGRSAIEIQISGLAAADARDPWIMITGFLVLGGCGVAFGAATPLAVLAAVAAGLLRTPAAGS